MRLRVFGVAIAMAIVLAALTNDALAQAFPNKPIVLIVPWPAGGTTDIAIRSLAIAAGKHLGKPVVIENRPGGSGTLAPVQMAMGATPDGYVVSQIPVSVFGMGAINNNRFDAGRDLTYIIGLTSYTFGVIVRSDARWRTFEELLSDARARPGKITFGTPGFGTMPHMTMERIARMSGIEWVHVPFRGSTETTNALLGGVVDVVADGSSWAELVNAGRFRLLVTWGVQRTANWPDVPTLRESGIDIVANSPYGIAGPKGMDPKLVATLHDAFRKAMDEPSYLAVLKRLGQEPFYLDSGDYAAFASRQIEEQRQLIKELGLKGDR
jgi:tripartite-type tricarboxylate transporter receptor subunit TctC